MNNKKPSHKEVVEAIKTIFKFIGEDPEREGLQETPKRVIKSYEEIFAGYNQDPKEILQTIFFEKANFHDFVILKNIKFKSMCEHHMLPIIGSVDIAYIPKDSIVGISKLARIVEVFARRLQIQERMTSEIADAIQYQLQPLGVAVKVSGLHHCMIMRGVNQETLMETMHFTGEFLTSLKYRQEFFSLINK
ncbi:MAG: GTP cyclohydrolase I FolE [Rickettsiaceae bacterium]|nr:GTP cyclohydrolase I FolE [Rickettsiaceae bacterium]